MSDGSTLLVNWPSGLRRQFKALVWKGVGSNPTLAILLEKHQSISSHFIVPPLDHVQYSTHYNVSYIAILSLWLSNVLVFSFYAVTTSMFCGFCSVRERDISRKQKVLWLDSEQKFALQLTCGTESVIQWHVANASECIRKQSTVGVFPVLSP